MPVSFPSTLQQAGRSAAVSNSTFYHLVEGLDIDFSVEQIAQSSDTIASQLPGQKFIVNSLSATFVPSLTVQVPTVAVGDIVRWTGNNWELFYDVSNTKTQVGIVYDKQTKSLYSYNSTAGEWRGLLSSRGIIDGGTFS